MAMTELPEDHLLDTGLHLEGEVRQQLSDSARWSRFIAIAVFAACGAALLFGLVGGENISRSYRRISGFGEVFSLFGDAGFIAAVLIVAAAVITVYYFLYNFSRKIKSALETESTAELNAGLRSLKIFFIITTVFALLGLLNTLYRMIQQQ